MRREPGWLWHLWWCMCENYWLFHYHAHGGVACPCMSILGWFDLVKSSPVCFAMFRLNSWGAFVRGRRHARIKTSWCPWATVTLWCPPTPTPQNTNHTYPQGCIGPWVEIISKKYYFWVSVLYLIVFFIHTFCLILLHYIFHTLM